MRYQVNNSNKSLKISLIIFATIIITFLLGAFIVRKTYFDNLKPVSASQKTQVVDIPLGSSVNQISAQLKKQGVIKSSWAFEWYVRNNSLRDKLQAGTYYLRPNQDVEEIVNVITQGKTATDLVTILPGQRIDQIRATLIRSGFTEDDVDKALDPAQYTGHPALVDKPAEASLEGYIYPESFQKGPKTTAQTIVKSSLDEMQKVLTPALKAAIIKQGLTVHQGIILASVIDQEVSNPDDKKVVSQVFLKRLSEDRRLQSDVTAFYGAIKADHKASVDYDSDYNTYLRDGLPIGPISNVSRLGLEAVAYPANSNYLYFVAGDDGKTYYSSTLEEHEKLTAEHCKKLCSPQ